MGTKSKNINEFLHKSVNEVIQNKKIFMGRNMGVAFIINKSVELNQSESTTKTTINKKQLIMLMAVALYTVSL
jgi:hypothetical protein